VAVACIVDRKTDAARAIAEAGLEYRFAVSAEDLGLA
jgi:orotate phosphoribosyltransferase